MAAPTFSPSQFPNSLSAEKNSNFKNNFRLLLVKYLLMASSGMKGFFREKKKSGISKPKSSKKTLKQRHSASCGSDVVQPPALVSHGSLDLQDEYDDKEEVLRQFDMNMAYGPCLGMSRLDRWERANAMGLHPPKEVEDLLRAGKVNSLCLWDGRV